MNNYTSFYVIMDKVKTKSEAIPVTGCGGP
jgi:hypothetical protein